MLGNVCGTLVRGQGGIRGLPAFVTHLDERSTRKEGRRCYIDGRTFQDRLFAGHRESERVGIVDVVDYFEMDVRVFVRWVFASAFGLTWNSAKYRW